LLFVDRRPVPSGNVPSILVNPSGDARAVFQNSGHMAPLLVAGGGWGLPPCPPPNPPPPVWHQSHGTGGGRVEEPSKKHNEVLMREQGTDVAKDDLGHAQSGKLTGGGKSNRAATLEKK